MAEKHHPKRDRRATEQRIIAAAFEEFIAVGQAGARVDRIAQRAHTNKANIYHYFGSKQGLFASVLEMHLKQSAPFHRLETFTDMYDAAAKVQAFIINDSSWMRLLTWEALEGDLGNITAEESRRAAWLAMVEQIQTIIDEGEIPNFDAAQLQLAIYSLVAFPVALPQITKLITGLDVESPEFLHQQQEFLKSLIALFTDQSAD